MTLYAPCVSIIIAVKSRNDNLDECVRHCLDLDYSDYEIFVCPDEAVDPPHPRVKIIPTGPTGPAEKRDVAATHATGEILAFLDDDTYPVRDWLKCAVRNFEDRAVGAVGGPAVTPASDDSAAQASGFVYASLTGGGNYAYRYAPLARREVDDYPTCNLLVRRSAFEAVGGFDTRFWPGEDTKLCLDLTRKLGLKIIYDPEALVYHHRRRLFGPHLRQVRSYGLHRGYFAKRFPATSLRVSYFLPTMIALWMTAGWAAVALWPILFGAYLWSWLIYLCLVTVSAYLAAQSGAMQSALTAADKSAPTITRSRPSAAKPARAGGLRVLVARDFQSPGDFALAAASRSLQLTFLVSLGIMATHFVYGIWFVVGLVSPTLKEEK